MTSRYRHAAQDVMLHSCSTVLLVTSLCSSAGADSFNQRATLDALIRGGVSLPSPGEQSDEPGDTGTPPSGGGGFFNSPGSGGTRFSGSSFSGLGPVLSRQGQGSRGGGSPPWSPPPFTDPITGDKEIGPFTGGSGGRAGGGGKRTGAGSNLIRLFGGKPAGAQGNPIGPFGAKLAGAQGNPIGPFGGKPTGAHGNPIGSSGARVPRTPLSPHNFGQGDKDPSAIPVSEPSTLLLFCAALSAYLLFIRRTHR